MVKWGMAGLTVLLVVVWIGSGRWRLAWDIHDQGGISIDEGVLVVAEPMPRGSVFEFSVLGPFIWAVAPSPDQFRLRWWFEAGRWSQGTYVTAPLWPLPLLSLLATAAAWRADAKYLRRVREGACPACGYDRAGLAAGSLCPECGKQPEAR